MLMIHNVWTTDLGVAVNWIGLDWIGIHQWIDGSVLKKLIEWMNL
jgi:hypothetical protein